MVTKEENDKGVMFLGDRYDEVEGYERGKLFGQRDTYTTNTLPDAYKDLPTGPINVNNHPEISRVTKLTPEQQKQALQNIANKGRAFRVNGQTYYKK